MSYCETQALAVGYGSPLLRDITLHAERGRILALILGTGALGGGSEAVVAALLATPIVAALWKVRK